MEEITQNPLQDQPWFDERARAFLRFGFDVGGKGGRAGGRGRRSPPARRGGRVSSEQPFSFVQKALTEGRRREGSERKIQEEPFQEPDWLDASGQDAGDRGAEEPDSRNGEDRRAHDLLSRDEVDHLLPEEDHLRRSTANEASREDGDGRRVVEADEDPEPPVVQVAGEPDRFLEQDRRPNFLREVMVEDEDEEVVVPSPRRTRVFSDWLDENGRPLGDQEGEDRRRVSSVLPGDEEDEQDDDAEQNEQLSDLDLSSSSSVVRAPVLQIRGVFGFTATSKNMADSGYSHLKTLYSHDLKEKVIFLQGNRAICFAFDRDI